MNNALDSESPQPLARPANPVSGPTFAQQQAQIAQLRSEALSYRAILGNIVEGVCFFDRDTRLMLCNRRFIEIYKLTPLQVMKGVRLTDLGRAPLAVEPREHLIDEYIAFCHSLVTPALGHVGTMLLPDGRSLEVSHQPLAEGGWVSTHHDVTELRHCRTLANERMSLQRLIDMVPDNLWVKDSESRFVIANDATARQIGLASSHDVIGKQDLDLHPSEMARKYLADEQRVVKSGQPIVNMEEYVVVPDGETAWMSSTKLPLRGEDDSVIGLVGISRDITARKKAEVLRDGEANILEMIAMSAPLEEVLHQLTQLIESQLKGIFASILLLDADGVHLWHGAGPNLPPDYVRAVDGIRIGPKVGSCGTAVHRREQVIVSDIETDRLWEDFRALAKTHGLRSCWSTPIKSYQGQVLGTFALYSQSQRTPTEVEAHLVDVATRIAGIAIERKHAVDRIQFMATHDPLTGLPNRALLKDRLAQALLFAKSHDRWACVIFIDLDNFKYINDSLGHSAGDDLLKVVADRMVASVRATDTVVRMGGDEFVIVLCDQAPDLDSVSAIAQGLQAAIAKAITLDGRVLRVTSSLGIANYPNDAIDAEALLANADAAMYRAKELGRDNFQFDKPALNDKAHERFQLLEELRDAIARQQFVLHYQPKYDVRTQVMFGVEALVRWRHPTLGLVSPALFIPLAEESGLIVPIGDWALNEACRQNKAWQDAGLPPLTVSVNVSARQFRERHLTGVVASALRDNQLDGKYLELELTESLIMQDLDQAVATMGELQGLGVQLSIDDFGTGYSSLSALKTFPVGRLKIDKSFIDGLPGDKDDVAVASAIISLGHKLNLKVIAEGVETAAQWEFLRENLCDEMQGFLLSRPVPPEELEGFFVQPE